MALHPNFPDSPTPSSTRKSAGSQPTKPSAPPPPTSSCPRWLPDNGVDGHNWRDDFQLTLHVQDDVRVTHPTGNIFLTNIHRVYAVVPAAKFPKCNFLHKNAPKSCTTLHYRRRNFSSAKTLNL